MGAWLGLVLGGALSACEQSPVTQGGPPEQGPEQKQLDGSQHAASDPLVISVIGASVSGGFVDPRPAPDGSRNETVDLVRALSGVLPDDEVRVRQCANVAMYLNPEGFGKRAVERALKGDPDLVLAVDFVFWFGYGRRAHSMESALTLQRQGLALLERFECPVVVGDYPDMASADPRMLPPGAVPEPDVLAALNEGVRRWAEGRDNVRLFRVSEWGHHIRTDGYRVTLDDGEVVARPEDLLQGDRLHMNRFGMALLAHRLLAEARAVLGGAHRLSRYEPTLDQFVEVTGAGPQVVEIRAREGAASVSGAVGADGR